MPEQDTANTAGSVLAAVPWPLWFLFVLLTVVLSAHLVPRWRDKIYRAVLAQPYAVLIVVLVYTAYFFVQMGNLQWQTDSRVFFPKDHPAIIYNSKIEDLFGVKEPIIIGVVNEEKGIYNPQTLARIKRITDQLYNMPGIIADRKIDIASLSSATFFSGNETEIRTRALMPKVPQTAEEIEALKKRVAENADLFVGNIVSADGKAAMIRAKVKEDKVARYQTYFAIKYGLFSREHGSSQKSWSGNGQWGGKQWSGNKWQKGGGQWPAVKTKKEKPATAGFDELKSEFELAGTDSIDTGSGDDDAVNSKTAGARPSASSADWSNFTPAQENGDAFYLAGRPIIEVLYGIQSLDDLKLMVPLLMLTLIVALFIIFRTGLGVLLPMAVMLLGIIWCMGSMGALGIPMYTISVMLPVILLAVGIGSAVHIMGHYYHIVLDDPHRQPRQLVWQLMHEMAMPLVATSVTTAAGFLSLTLAEMPPLQIFGLFTALGVLYVWLLTISLMPAALAVVKPKVGAYLEKRRSLRVHNEEGLIARLVVRGGSLAQRNAKSVLWGMVAVSILAVLASRWLYVDSSWIGDFRQDTEIVKASTLLNEKFAGTVFLNIIVDAKTKDGIKDPAILRKMEALQAKVEELPEVGDSISVVDHLKSMNMAFNAGNPAFKKLPDKRGEVAEYLFLASISGRPELLDEVVDADYRNANITVAIKTDRIVALKQVIDHVKAFVAEQFAGTDVDVNTAGMANNSYVWSDLLIRSQLAAIVVSKLAVFLIAAFLLRSLVAGLFVVLPVAVTTLWVAGLTALFGIPLDVSTTLAAGIAIGVGVDYAIHYLYRYMREYRESHDIEQASLMSLRRAGRTIVLNAMVVSAGFLVLIASQFPPNTKTGYFVSVYIILSCVIALMLLPAMLELFKARFIYARASSTEAMTVPTVVNSVR